MNPSASHTQDNSAGVDIRRIRVPIVMMASALAVIVAIVLSAGFSIWSAKTHEADNIVHLERGMVLRNGGPVYRNHLTEMRNELREKIDDVGKKNRAAMRKMRINCRRSRRGGLACTTVVPEPKDH